VDELFVSETSTTQSASSKFKLTSTPGPDATHSPGRTETYRET